MPNSIAARRNPMGGILERPSMKMRGRATTPWNGRGERHVHRVVGRVRGNDVSADAGLSELVGFAGLGENREAKSSDQGLEEDRKVGR